MSKDKSMGDIELLPVTDSDRAFYKRFVGLAQENAQRRRDGLDITDPMQLIAKHRLSATLSPAPDLPDAGQISLEQALKIWADAYAKDDDSAFASRRAMQAVLSAVLIKTSSRLDDVYNHAEKLRTHLKEQSNVEG